MHIGYGYTTLRKLKFYLVPPPQSIAPLRSQDGLIDIDTPRVRLGVADLIRRDSQPLCIEFLDSVGTSHSPSPVSVCWMRLAV
jgi:hypothetical protein